MTAKEKARQLVDKFGNIEFKVLQEYIPKHYEVAKSCAHVVCDECLKEHCHESEHKDPKSQDRWIEFWQDVKCEIDAL
jgi:hypothetical protein